MFGFCFTIVPFVYMILQYGTSFNTVQTIPSWFYFTYMVCFFMYRILDEMDGKQARRTGNSSPLGMLFDHGCDAFTVGFILMTTGRFLGFGDNLGTMMVVSGSVALFHYTTLEEYYVGGLFLGFMNPVTDLSILVYGLYAYLGFAGNTFFLKEIFKADDLWTGSPSMLSNDIFKIVCYVVIFVQLCMW
jgi:ethanolaminephosphotransferase